MKLLIISHTLSDGSFSIDDIELSIPTMSPIRNSQGPGLVAKLPMNSKRLYSDLVFKPPVNVATY